MNRRHLFGLLAGLIAAPAELLAAKRPWPIIHRGEDVIPADLARRIHIHNHVSAWDRDSIKGMVNSSAFRTAMKDAAKGFSRTYASHASVPYVGWVMAPGAAAAAFRRVAVFERMASLDVGVWNVPHDMKRLDL